MRLPLSWLRDFVAFDGSAEVLAERLITSGFEVERILRPGAPDESDNHGHFVLGRVADCDKHPHADRLRLCRVETGDAEPRQIVCGATNFQIGDMVVVALPGALLPGAEAPLKQAKLRGETSDGMMLSERELGLSDDHDGIIVLPAEAGFEVGSFLADHVALDEAVLDLSVESNRGDCLSVYGMAREVAVLHGLDLAPVPGADPAPAASGTTADLVQVGIEAWDRCSRFTARGFRGVAIGPSPFRVRQRLAAAGIRPISNVVDVTNYVMHELGNPLHVYDADCIPGRTLTARLAKNGERVVTLDGKDRELTGDVLVIADADGPSGIAGVMGGAASEITDETTNVVLESATFERSGIQRTTRALGLRTDGSNRWEKGVNPHLAPIAAQRAAELIVAWAGGEMLADPQDVHEALPEPNPIRLRVERVGEVLGMDVEPVESERILTGLGFDPARVDGAWTCTTPFWRWLDATREIDLIEEIGRVHGLAHVPTELPRIPPGLGGETHPQGLRRRVEEHWAGAGLHEVVTVSLGDPERRARYGLVDRSAVALRNPLSADLSELRTSLLPDLVDVVLRNRAVGERDVHVFEVGRVYAPGGTDGLAVEALRLGLAVAGHLGGMGWLGAGSPCDASTVFAVVDSLLGRLGLAAERAPIADHPLLHPGRAAAITVGGTTIGVAGELHPALAAGLELDGPCAIADLDLAALAVLTGSVARFAGLSAFPPVHQDIAVVVASTVAAADLIAVCHEAGGGLLTDAEVFDVYCDAERLGEDRASIAIRLAFQADDRTLTEDEATEARERITAALAERCEAELRG
ncbi:MAG: phenylalanine--tRNA ligase subunit beta [Candidatus Nanopelagicaceae bacterium]